MTTIMELNIIGTHCEPPTPQHRDPAGQDSYFLDTDGYPSQIEVTPEAAALVNDALNVGSPVVLTLSIP